MGLRERLEEDLKEAMRARSEVRLSTIRMLRAAVKNREIELRHPLSDEEILPVIRTQAKQRRESIEAFEKGGRLELAEREREELALLEGYLPPAPTEEEIARVVAAVISETEASGPKAMGAVMKEALQRLGPVADGKQVSAVAKRLLS